ncbi:MAG: imidazole glycerol phosphate synthase subunit HisH, partial [Halobacteriovoraceae bacterium]|nr:imidazole glycerol phosphate synthase subunit HisH [Halobacteriovoraceae bacterium]
MSSKSVAIVDYGVGNLFNIQRAMDYIDVKSKVTRNKKEIMEASHLLLPGVGAFGPGMDYLKNYELVDTVKEFANSGKPTMGICLGMQLLLSISHEGGDHHGLNLIKGDVSPMSRGKGIKIPQITWNALTPPEGVTWKGTILEGLDLGSYVYFLHGYKVNVEDKNDCIAETEYGYNKFCSVLKRENISGCQFHPETSSKNGLKIFK